MGNSKCWSTVSCFPCGTHFSFFKSRRNIICRSWLSPFRVSLTRVDHMATSRKGQWDVHFWLTFPEILMLRIRVPVSWREKGKDQHVVILWYFLFYSELYLEISNKAIVCRYTWILEVAKKCQYRHYHMPVEINMWLLLLCDQRVFVKILSSACNRKHN